MCELGTADKQGPCEYCGIFHERLRCPWVKAIEYHPDGSRRRVEFFSPLDTHVTPMAPQPPFHPEADQARVQHPNGNIAREI